MKYLRRISVVLVIFICCAMSAYCDTAPWKEKAWKNLLHVKVPPQGDEFYLTEKNDGTWVKNEWFTLLGELEKGLAKNQKSSDHPACRFPARAQLIKKSYPDKKFADIRCEDYQKYLNYHQAKSVFLVFSSYHMGSASSLFGHTLLRLAKGKHPKTGKIHELLDVGVNFAANQTTKNPIAYTFLGLTGGFKGTLSSIPYFYKIREYNDYESRDLWSYELNLNKDQVDRLMAHLWEIGHTYFDYYYLDVNCSYILLSILDAVNPEWNLVDRLSYFTLPTETIQVLADTPGLVGQIHFRPSLRKTFLSRFNLLSVEQKKLVLNANEVNISQSEILKDAKLLEVLLDYIDYKYAGDILVGSGPKWAFKNDLLQVRSTLPTTSTALPITPPTPPHHAHLPNRISIGAGVNESSDYLKFQYRGAAHGLEDFSVGWPANMHMNLGDMIAHYHRPSESLKLEKLSLINMGYFFPLEDYEFKTSLDFQLEGRRQRIIKQSDSCYNCFAPSVGGSFGLTWKDLLVKDLYIATLASTQYSYNERLRHNSLFAYGAKLRSWWERGQAKLVLEQSLWRVTSHKNIFSSETNMAAIYQLERNKNLRLNVSWIREFWQTGFDYSFFF